MVAFVGKEGGNSSSSGRSIVVSKLREQKEIGPVVLLVVAVGAEILFQSLVRAFGLTIAFGVISRGEVESDVEGFGEGTEEVGDELRSAIGGDMGRSSVLGEHMEYEEFSKLRRVDGVMSGDEDGLLGETINDDKNGGEAGGGWELFDEVHGDGVPWLIGDRELLESSVGAMTRGFRMVTSSTGFDIVLHEGVNSGPSVLAADKFQSLVDAKVTRERVVMLIAEDSEPEVSIVRNVDAIVKPEETRVIDGPAGIKRGFGHLGRGHRVRGKSREDVGMEGGNVKSVDATEDRFNERGCAERSGELFGGEDGLIVLGVNGGVATTSLFKVDVPTSSQGVRLSTEFSGAEADDEVELGEVFGPASLPASEEFGGGEVGEVLVIRDNIDWRGGALKEVAPGFESFEDSKEFLVMDVVIPLGFGEGAGMESNGVDFTVINDGENGGEGVVRSIRFHNERSIGTPLGENRSGGESFLKGVKSVLAFLSPSPLDILAGQAGEGNGDVGVSRDETTIEVGKTEEGLDVLDFPRSWPVQDNLDFVFRHTESVRGENVSEVLHGVRVELTLVRASIETMEPETAEDFLDMFPVIGHVFGEDEDIVEIDNDTDVEEILEDVVHEPLERGGSIGKSERHNKPFKGAIASPKGGFPFVTFGDADQVVSMPEVDLGIDRGATGSGEEVGDKWKGVAVLLGNLIETTVIDAKAERTVFLLDEENRSTVRRSRLADEASGEVLINELTQSAEFELGKGVDRTWRRRLISFQVEGKIIGAVRIESVSLGV